MLEVSEQTQLSPSMPTDGALPQHLGGDRDRVNSRGGGVNSVSW